MPARTLRVAAYAVCVRGGSLLLAHYTARDEWALPGGGVDHGEHPYDATVREVGEETGYEIAIEELLGISSATTQVVWDVSRDVHSVQIFYSGRVTGGDLRHEVGGSTDQAAWFDLAEVPALPRTSLVDIGLSLWRERPADGRHF